MGVYLMKRSDGSLDPRWHGQWTVDGKRKHASLNLWRGTPPGPGEKEGDAAFERSRSKALETLKTVSEEEKSKAEETVLTQKILRARYGVEVGRVKLSELAERWDAFPGKESVTAARRARVHSVLGTFVKFMGEKFPRVTEAGALTAAHFKAYFESIDESGVSARSWNDHLTILRGVLAKLDGQSKGFRDYLALLPKRDEKTVHRRPFTGEELEEIFAAAKEVDPELHPVIVAAACTALRRGDVAMLEWESLDLVAGFVAVKTTRKTGEPVEIPIFPPFMAVLKEAERERREGNPYVFPKVAAAYQESPDSLDRRLRRVLSAAGFVTPGKGDAGEYPAPATAGEAVAKVNAGMVAGRWSEARRQKGLAILKRHLQGQNGRTIAAEMGIARGAVSTYLHEMENVGRVALVSPAASAIPRKSTLAERREGEQRARSGSLCGWHSFRTTFCTLALANGVPMEILRKITGHRTAEIVLKHYDRRGREAMRKAIGTAMPKAIAGVVEASKTNEGSPGEGEEFVAVPSALATLLAGATPKQLEAVAAILKKGGNK